MEPWANNDLNQLIHPNMDSSCGNIITYCLSKVSCTDEPGPGNLRRPSFSMFCQLHRFYWPCMAAQAKEHIGKYHTCLAFKAKQPKVPLENIVATHPLELIHLDYLCLEPGKGLEENVLVVTDHFTRYTQAYVTRTQTAHTTDRTLWDKFIVH